MSCDITEWSATASDEGGERKLQVVGEGECTMGGYQLRLEPTNEGTPDIEEDINLRLEIDEPESGPDVMTPVRVEFETTVSPKVKLVRLHGLNGGKELEITD
jgi:hypothetical protein